ncbi:EEIG1/EHBP1 protein amino-terminal domain protein [Rhynchospora pubera]|uniref:EEIG1/EHBP1 protein amino-terminal domain protein n=1 Tax=Rhynchospora pubera TaxID=906938 RepID=A0AAV8FZE4_9POAL|nr:EEIG1/EHBP1 protein amino-terminal domain protein [Rhynchospora pubera]
MVEPKAMAKSTKYKVTMAVTRLEGLLLSTSTSTDEQEKALVEVKLQGQRHGLFPFLAGRKKRFSVSQRKRVECGGLVEWERQKEAARLDNVSVYVSGSSFHSDSVSGFDPSSHVSFSVLFGYQGQKESKQTRLEVIGTTNISLAECVRGCQPPNKHVQETIAPESVLEPQIKKVPITLRNGSVTYNATLDIDLQVVEAHPGKGSKVTPSNRDEQSTDMTNILHRQSSSCTEFVGPHDLLDSGKNLVSSRRRKSFGASTSHESGLFRINSILPWRRASKDSDANKDKLAEGDNRKSKKLKELDEDPIGSWEKKEFICREAETKLKTEVFFASIDQRDESADGQSACTALVVVFTHALLSKRLVSPTKQDLDMLIRDGSSEWRKLCDDATLLDRFPNKHFDLETVLTAKVRPISVLDEKSFIGFFQPESFISLSGAKSFDEIWNEITTNVQEGEAYVYIVSWNDHFFVLKVECGACYIIDTLGERLFEGCKKAYMLKFDESSEMYKLPEKNGEGSKEEELIVRGKECCREFINRFLAAIPLREELDIEKKGSEAVAVGAPHQRLQIEFHYATLSERSSSNLDTEVQLLDSQGGDLLNL